MIVRSGGWCSRYDVANGISQAHKDVRDTFAGGSAGQLVSAVIWFASAAACMWHSFRLGESVVLLGGFFIFLLTQLVLRGMGVGHGLPKGHPMNVLGMQVAFPLPLTLPVVIAIGWQRPGCFYPALMVTLGTHDLPFVLRMGCGSLGCCARCWLEVVWWLDVCAAAGESGGWCVGGVLLVFSVVGWRVAREGMVLPGWDEGPRESLCGLRAASPGVVIPGQTGRRSSMGESGNRAGTKATNPAERRVCEAR